MPVLWVRKGALSNSLPWKMTLNSWSTKICNHCHHSFLGRNDSNALAHGRRLTWRCLWSEQFHAAWWLKESQILTCLDWSEPCKIRKKRAGPLGSRQRRSSVDPSILSRSSVSDPKKERSAPLGSRHRRTSVFHAVIAYQVGHPSPSRLYFTYREKHLKENLYAPHWQSWNNQHQKNPSNKAPKMSLKIRQFPEK